MKTWPSPPAQRAHQPRRMRQVVDLIRGERTERALGILRFSTRHSSRDLEKLLMSAIANWGGQRRAEAPTRPTWW